MRYARTFALLLLAAVVAAPAAAQPEARSLCVYDPSGAMGDAFNMAKDYRAAAMSWKVELTLTPYTDEKTAAEDFKAGKCDAVLLTGVRGRAFNKFSGTVEAMGALTSYTQLRTVLKLLANPKAAARMKSGDYETVAIFPAGAVYLFLRDREMKGVSDLAGKRIATMDFDDAAITMVDRAGASMVPADLGTFSGMFNNGSVDVAYAPATAYEPLELAKGVGKKGAIAKYPLAQLTLQLIVRNGRFPEGFGDTSRKYAADNYEKVLQVVTRAEKSIPAGSWLELSDLGSYDALFRTVRVKLRDKGTYDPTMLSLLRRVRCQEDAARAECAEKLE